MPSWVWLIIIIVIILIVWWALSRSAETYEHDLEVHHEEEETAEIGEGVVMIEEPAPTPPPEESMEVIETRAEEVVVEIEPDDLTKIEGIGPKISSLLQAAGIKTFEQLSRMDAGRIEEILQANALGFHDPKSWPGQAELANLGKWDELQVMQDELKGGRAAN